MYKDDINTLENRLNLVRYQTKKDRIISILQNPNQIALNDNTIKDGRLWLVGFLKHVGYSETSILDIIKTYNKWEDYKEEETARQVHWLVNRKSIINKEIEQSKMQNCSVFTQVAGTTECDEYSNINKPEDIDSDDIINLFFDICKPININPPHDINKAVIYYHNMGFHIIPKIRNEKRPAVKWKIYQENQPPLYIVKRWNFSNGIILLGTRTHSYLDIDIKSAKHDKGLENFDESRLKGWYYERTQNGGYHIFGYGFFPKGMKGLVNDAVQIKHLGGYIVTYPTSGYIKSSIIGDNYVGNSIKRRI
jgi:hypothetical protein